MPDYDGDSAGELRGRTTRVIITLALAGTAALLLAGCQAVLDTAPSSIVVPPTNALSTERAPESSAPPSTPTSRPAPRSTTDNSTGGTIDDLVRAGPRVDNADFHIVSTSPTGPRQDSSGFHFTTPRRDLRCSVGNNPTGDLACVADRPVGASQPPADAGDCDWAADRILLGADGASTGACANRYPVGYRAAVVGFGESIVVSRYSCLVEPEGLICLESSSGRGFSLSDQEFLEVSADDPAAEAFAEPS